MIGSDETRNFTKLRDQLRPYWVDDLRLFSGVGGSGGGGATIANINTAIDAHRAESNPHAIYLTQAEGDAIYSLLGHTHDDRYYTEAESDARFLPLKGSAQYQIPVTGSTPFTAAYTALSSFAGSGLAFSAGFNIGQSDGIVVNANDIAVRRYVDSGLAFGLDGGLTLGTPIAVSISTTSVVTGVQHGHAVISSSDVGTTPAEALLKSTPSGGLTLATLTSKGNVNVTNGGDFTVGANILFVDASGTNVGINCAPDAQFDLDVAGNLRAQGWIVGKHAIQLDGALLITHFDGAKKKADYSGEPNGHKGQVGTVTGSPAFVPGKFGKGFAPSRAATNLCLNPSAETNTTNTAQSNGTVSRVATDSVYGGYCFKWTRTLSGQWCSVSITSQAAGTVLFVQCMVRAQTGQSVSIRISDGSSYETVAGSITANGQWMLLSGSATVPAGKTATRILLYAGGTADVYIDAVQVTAGYAVPYFDGSMPGCSWTGTAHGSSSTKPVTKLSYVATGNVDAQKGTFAAWVQIPVATNVNTQPGIFTWWNAYNTESLYVHFGDNHSGINFVSYAASALNANLTGSTSGWVAGSWHHVIATWSAYDNVSQLFVDGSLVDSGTYSAPSITSSTLTIGEQFSGRYMDGVIDDVVILDNALSTDAARAVYESNAPVFAESSTYQFRTGNSLVWGDEEGLWVLDTAGGSVLGVSGVDSKNWGGSTLDAGDIQFGQYGSSNGGWLRFDRNGVSSKPLISLGYGTSTVAEFDSGGSRISGVLDVTGTIRTKVSGTVYTTLNSSGLVMTEQTNTSGFGYHAAAAIHQGYLTMYSGAYDGYLPSSIARRTLIEQEYSGGSGEYTQIVLRTHAPDFSSNVNQSTLTIQSSPDGDNFFEFRSAATSLSYKAYIKFESLKFSTAALGAYYGKILCRIDGSSTDRAIPIYSW